jgi:hypothetical protein
MNVRSRGLPDRHKGDVRLVEIVGLDINTCLYTKSLAAQGSHGHWGLLCHHFENKDAAFLQKVTRNLLEAESGALAFLTAEKNGVGFSSLAWPLAPMQGRRAKPGPRGCIHAGREGWRLWQAFPRKVQWLKQIGGSSGTFGDIITQTVTVMKSKQCSAGQRWAFCYNLD